MNKNIIVKCVASIFLLAISVFGAVKGYDSFRKVESSLLLDGIEAKAGIIDDFCEWYLRKDYINHVISCTITITTGDGMPIYRIESYPGTYIECERTENGKGEDAHCNSRSCRRLKQ